MTVIQQKLIQLRHRVKAIVVVDTLLSIVIFAAIGFIAAFCFDYSPVWLGMTELPVIPRMVMLIGIFGGAVYLLATRGIGRLQTKISDETLKLLIERKYPEFLDSLLTLSTRNDESEETARRRFMLDVAERDVSAKMEGVNVNQIVSYDSIKWKSATLLLLLLGFSTAIWFAPDLISKGFRRTFFLSQESLPRQSSLLNARIRVFNDDEFIVKVLPPEFHSLQSDTVTRLAVGSSIEISVDAIAQNSRRKFKIPRSCRLRYQLIDGRRGSVVMSQTKRSGDGSVAFATKKGALDGMDSDGKIWIQGYDCTTGPFSIEWVDEPAVVSLSKSCNFPEYLVEHSVLWRNGTTPLLNNERLPAGTTMELIATTNRSKLSKVIVWDHLADRRIVPSLSVGPETEIRIPIVIETDLVDLSIAMVDADGIASQNLTRIRLSGIVDRPPSLAVTPLGIGAAITANARIPIEITASDEFGIASGHIDLVNDGKVIASKRFVWGSKDRQIVVVDLLDLRRTDAIVFANDNNGNSRLLLQTFLSDYNLKNSEAIGQEYEFEIVSEIKFLQLVEREEAGLRKRLESVGSELDGARGLLLMHRKAAAASEEQFKLASSPIWLQRVRLQAQKSSLEINDISNAFGRLIDQLENNRVEVSKKQGRLVNDVKLPLLALVEEEFSKFSSMLQDESTRVRATLPNPEANSNINKSPEIGGAGSKEAKESFSDSAEQLLSEHALIMNRLDSIIQRLAKFESYGELLDVVRGLIDEQKGLIDQTQKERDRKAFDSLLD